jgi:broad specificity phosphatase PhoE
MKKVWCIRHGTALHNELYWYIGTRAFSEFKDTNLTAKGHEESIHLGKTWDKIKDIELVLVSPLTRTLQTATNIFKEQNVRMVAIDELMEHPQCFEVCNQRLDKKILINQYPHVDFSKISDNHLLYWHKEYDHYEELERLKKRINDFKNIVKTFDENNIAIVSHSSYLGQMMFNKIEDPNNELYHCHPYEYEI